MPVDFYYNPASGPCRAVMMLCKIADIQVNMKFLDMIKEDHKKQEYLKINPKGTVPYLVDNGYHLNESRAILLYLADKYGKHDHVYPKDVGMRAQIWRLMFEDLENYIKGVGAWVYPQLNGKPADPEKEKQMRTWLCSLDKELEGKKYILGDHLTAADCSIVSDVATLFVFDYDISCFKNLDAYMKRVKSEKWYEEVQSNGIAFFKKVLGRS